MRTALTMLLVLCLVPAALAAPRRYEDRPLPTRSGVTSVSRVEPRFGAVATSLAGKRTEVRCWSKADWARINGEALAEGDSLDYVGGFYLPPGFRIHLAPSICAGLVDLAYRGRRPTDVRSQAKLALAVDTLAHESVHRRGFLDEATTECYAVQLVYRTARALGVPSAYAASLARLNWRVNYPAHPPQYLSGECRNGGRLDLDRSRAAFP